MDMSTNGTFVNGIRVGKGKEVPLRAKDVLRLSQATGGDRNKLIQCALQTVANNRDELLSLVSAARLVQLMPISSPITIQPLVAMTCLGGSWVCMRPPFVLPPWLTDCQSDLHASTTRSYALQNCAMEYRTVLTC